MLTIRRAEPADAQAIGAVFDAAVREGWKYLGELAARPMFPPEEWDDGTVRESEFRGVHQREPRLVKSLA